MIYPPPVPVITTAIPFTPEPGLKAGQESVGVAPFVVTVSDAADGKRVVSNAKSFSLICTVWTEVGVSVAVYVRIWSPGVVRLDSGPD